ncbi:MAG TPA: DNA polymerase III subunit delta' [Steroidobacter sp.]|jgi:DNA polymerase-3 subunit delta'|nr:DNA polymerase III subunit delta' [Steroidobacter sp.]
MADAPLKIPPHSLLPWHTAAVDQLRQAWSNGRLPHALLMQGPQGLGKGRLASWLGAAVLCERSHETALEVCGNCPSCTLIEAGTHPDLTWVAPEEDKQQISIEQVRDAADRLTRTSYRRGYKVAVIDPAHQMTTSAANSVLKTLEEPSPPSLLILVSSRPSALPATVRSRCQKLSIARPTTATALDWLQHASGGAVEPALLEFAGGAPLLALEYAGGKFNALNDNMQKGLRDLLTGRADVTQVAAEWEKDALADRLVWLDLWLSALARAALTGNADLITFPGGQTHLPSPPHTLNISDVYSLVDRARALKAQLARTALQRELAVESWLFALLDVLTPTASTRKSGFSDVR